MKFTNIKIWSSVLLAQLLLVSCSKNEDNPGGQQTMQAKTIEWEVFHELDTDETIRNFAITDDAKYLFYTNGLNGIYRIDLATGSKTTLFAQPTGSSYVHFINEKLYLLYEKGYKSYFAVSDDLGANLTEYEVGAYTNYAAGWYQGTFMKLIVNRMFITPDGDLILPHIMDKANNATYLQDNKLIAISTDGGATWSRKDCEHSYISAKQGNRLFAISEGWTGVETFASKLFHSDDEGTNWQGSTLSYSPQAVDRENNLIAGSGNKIQKLKGNSWRVYTWEGQTSSMDGLVFLSGLKYGGVRGDDPNGRQMDDIEFDADNYIYVIGRNMTNICRTKLN
jgi:hypothetical protein